jgi:hypothetical protein
MKICRRHATLHAVGGVLQGFTPVKKKMVFSYFTIKLCACVHVCAYVWVFHPGVIHPG